MSDDLLLQYVKDIKNGQDALIERVGNIEIVMAEQRGERKANNKFVAVFSAAVSIMTTAVVNYFVHRPD